MRDVINGNGQRWLGLIAYIFYVWYLAIFSSCQKVPSMVVRVFSCEWVINKFLLRSGQTFDFSPNRRQESSMTSFFDDQTKKYRKSTHSVVSCFDDTRTWAINMRKLCGDVTPTAPTCYGKRFNPILKTYVWLEVFQLVKSINISEALFLAFNFLLT